MLAGDDRERGDAGIHHIPGCHAPQGVGWEGLEHLVEPVLRLDGHVVTPERDVLVARQEGLLGERGPDLADRGRLGGLEDRDIKLTVQRIIQDPLAFGHPRVVAVHTNEQLLVTDGLEVGVEGAHPVVNWVLVGASEGQKDRDAAVVVGADGYHSWNSRLSLEYEIV